MATVIDALVVTLGLNAQNFLQGNREANQSLDRTRTNTRTLTQEEEKREKLNTKNRTNRDRDHIKQKTQQKENIEGFKELTKTALTFFGTATTLGGMATFIGGITQANSQLYRTATNLGTNTESLTAWGGAVEQAGGNAQEAINTMSMLSKSMTEILLTGQSAQLPFFRQLGVDIHSAMKEADPLSAILKQIGEGTQKNISTVGRANAFNMLQMMGIDYGTADILMGSRKELDLLIKRQEKIGLLGMDNARNSRELARQWTELRQRGVALGRDVEAVTTPAITKMLNNLMDFATENPKIVAGIATIAAVMLSRFAPVRAALMAIGGLLVADDWQTWGKNGDSVLGKLNEKASQLWYTLNDAFNNEDKLKTDIGFLQGLKSFINNAGKVNDFLVFGTDTPKSTINKGQGDTGIRKTGKREDLEKKNTHRFTPKELMNDLIQKGYSQDDAQKQVDFYEKEAGLDNRGRINAQIDVVSKADALASARLAYKENPSKLNLQRLQQLQNSQAARQLASQPQGVGSGSTSTSTSSTNVGQVVIHTQAKDAQGIANEFPRALGNQAESGAH